MNLLLNDLVDGFDAGKYLSKHHVHIEQSVEPCANGDRFTTMVKAWSKQKSQALHVHLVKFGEHYQCIALFQVLGRIEGSHHSPSQLLVPFEEHIEVIFVRGLSPHR